MSTLQTTPMMAQWHACKKDAQGALLLFRLGDFYEAFYEDAEKLAKELDITLTKRQNIPMAGVPHHMCDTYVDRLVSKGLRVAIAEQMEDPRQTKGIVKRKITRIVTPGTVIRSSLLENKESRFLASVVQIDKYFGFAYLDITTATFWTVECEGTQALLDALTRIRPKELLLPKKWKKNPDKLESVLSDLKKTFQPTIHYIESWLFDHTSAFATLSKHFGVHSLDGFGLKEMFASISAAGALLSYVKEELHLPTEHIDTIAPSYTQGVMRIDKSTQHNLELTHPLHEGQKQATLLHLMDETKTPMGGRLLRHWLLHPLLCVEKISDRQKKIGQMTQNFPSLLELRRHLASIRDLERMMMRIETGFALPPDLTALRLSLEQIPHIRPLVIDSLEDLAPLVDLIGRALVDHPSPRLSSGKVFRKGYDRSLDELYQIKTDSQSWITAYQARLKEKFEIKTLKVGYTKAFGYYIEVSKAQSGKAPPCFYKRQTLVNAERFTTDDLKEFEYKILSADQKISAIETRLFDDLLKEVRPFAKKVRKLAQSIAKIDCFSNLAYIALQRDYVCPTIDTSRSFAIEGGRHPVIEAQSKEPFIPNDLSFDGEKRQLAVITGPNMAGKSTFLRQAALIAILAQMGSFVPAKRAYLGIVDRVFSRIGASDDLTRGQSTFMVEMTETANILRNATDRSLVILDEIGRGTSTFDGISIAWAVAKHLLSTPGKQAKTLFATHYFEMAELSKQCKGCFNLHVSVAEDQGEIAFLRKIERGVASKSYGIEVARLAGIPLSVLLEAKKKLTELQMPNSTKQKGKEQLDLFSSSHIPHPKNQPHPLVKELQELDVDSLSPRDALLLLFEWKKHVF